MATSVDTMMMHLLLRSLVPADLLIVVLLETFANRFLVWLPMSDFLEGYFDFHGATYHSNQPIPHIMIVFAPSTRKKRNVKRQRLNVHLAVQL